MKPVAAGNRQCYLPRMPRSKESITNNKFTVAAALQETAMLLEISGAERFRGRAYARAARSVADLSEDLGLLVAEQRLTEIKGVGRTLAAQIKELYTSGHSAFLDELRALLPPGVIELSRVLSVKKIAALHEALGITSIADLRAAAEAGKIKNVRGFGARVEAQILKSITEDESRDARILLLHALRTGDRILEHVRSGPDVLNAELAGGIRRWKETVSTIRIVASTRQPEVAVEHFLKLPLVTKLEERDSFSSTVRIVDQVKVVFTGVPPEAYAVALLSETGSAAHVAKLGEIARRQKVALNGNRTSGAKGRARRASFEQEADIYRRLGMQYVIPEMREDEGEIELALAGELPSDWLTISDIQGMTHCHTLYSDGRHTIEEMALAAEAMGMHYITITDHSPTAFYANGVKIDRLKRQWDEIDRVQAQVKVRLLRGTESDILQNGDLDYPDQILEKFDIVIASVHNRYKLDEAGMTKRLVTAMRNPFFKIWGHALGRLINRRPPFACRVEEVLDAIAESRAAVEINGDPHRLDMEPRWLREARKRGIKFVVSTDAHSVTDLQHLKFGIGIARRAGVRKREVLNTFSVDRFRKHVRPT